MKVCIKCAVEKPLDAFYQYTYKDIKTCIECWNGRQKKHHREHTAWMRKLKEAPCTDCGIQYPPPAMEWDHVRGTKVKAVAAMRSWSRERCLEEIAKCDLVCANCHRMRTAYAQERGEIDYTRKGFTRRKILE